MKNLVIERLDSGWTRLGWSQEIWAQVPPGYLWQDGVEEQYCFNPAWTHKLINARIAARRGKETP